MYDLARARTYTIIHIAALHEQEWPFGNSSDHQLGYVYACDCKCVSARIRARMNAWILSAYYFAHVYAPISFGRVYFKSTSSKRRTLNTVTPHQWSENGLMCMNAAIDMCLVSGFCCRLSERRAEPQLLDKCIGYCLLYPFYSLFADKFLQYNLRLCTIL